MRLAGRDSFEGIDLIVGLVNVTRGSGGLHGGLQGLDERTIGARLLPNTAPVVAATCACLEATFESV